MTMEQKIAQIRQYGIVPVVVLEKEIDAEWLAEALVEGGLPCAEITFRTKAAEASIREMLKRYPDMMVGAGTVLNVEQAEAARAAGAKFIVSPGFNPKVVSYCLEHRILVIPGIATPSELEGALEMGLSYVKFFPSEALGGLEMIKAMSEPYGSVSFLPTGGISAGNLAEYLACERILACGGSWMVKKELIQEKRKHEIIELVKEAVEIVRKIRESR